MRRKTKNSLIVAVLVAIVAVLLAWYAARPRPQYTKLATLQKVAYSPPVAGTGCAGGCPAGEGCVAGGCVPTPPAFTFTFSEPLVAAQVAGTSAALKSFVLDPATPPATAAAAASLIAALLHNGGVPFAPVLASSTTITSNSVPASMLGVTLAPLVFTGSGSMWFAAPPKSKSTDKSTA